MINELFYDVLNYDIMGAKGKLVKHLIGFSLDPNWWSVYAQQYNRNQLPFVLQEKPLRKLLLVYNKVKTFTDDELIDKYISGFQHSIVNDIAMYKSFHKCDDFDEKWKSQAMSFRLLSLNPTKYHKVWKYFFTTNDNKNIPNLICDIEKVLEFHERSKELNGTMANNISYTETELENEIVKSIPDDDDDDNMTSTAQIDVGPIVDMIDTVVKRRKIDDVVIGNNNDIYTQTIITNN